MTAEQVPGLFLVGNPGVEHVGAHLHQAAQQLGLRHVFVDSNRAFAGPGLVARINWWLRGHRPPRLRAFSERVVQECQRLRPAALLSTGLAPIDARALEGLGRLGVRRLNFLTDDPWNSAHRAPWFLDALRLYDQVFSPRRANLGDLRELGCREVTYLPFAYAPALHFPELPSTPDELRRYECDVVFAGGADPDRVSTMNSLLQAGFRVGLYGGYWERYRETRGQARGLIEPTALRKAVGGAKVALCLVRRANRDGHAMRSFEVAAMGGCPLAEDTVDHRELFGPDGQAALYFSSRAEMIDRLRWLLTHDTERCRLAAAARRVVSQGQHTYRDRLAAMLGLARTCR